ncbi:HAMP domain-containing sensor histidine kinase [Bosea sp. 117]|uniref:sensor histidine kinase n=1 Tax=Bosea sp. 117 TaxID=1125973 RepID=UPI0004946721|nr:HAMP domain-containing sensor histidine kinase [Bosea sp. 117]
MSTTAAAVREVAGRRADGSASAERRAHVSRSVREVRDRLTSTTGSRPAYDHELIRLFVDNRTGATPGIVAMTILTGGLAMIWLPPLLAACWAVFILALHGLSVTFCRRFLREGANPRTLRRYRLAFATLDGVLALAWLALMAGILTTGATEAREFALVAALVFIGGMAMLSATIPAVVYAGTLPVIVATTGYYLMRGSLGDIALAVMVCEASACFLIMARRLNGNALATLEARGEKDALIGELEQAKAKSDDAALRAEAASLAKSRFLAQMSHELRTPLNAILGFSEVMKSEILGAHSNPTYREYAGDIHASGQHLLNLINEILDLSRIEAGRYELNEEAVALAHVVEDCRHLLKIRAKARAITIHEVYEPDLPRLWADERALRQICLNLLSNAIKFTPQGGEIWIKVGWTYSGGQYLSVRDTGPGIPEHEIPIVMASFGQGSNAIKTAEQGAGLGLPIVKGLVDLHGGTFHLKSKLRVGTEVIVTFPSERVMAALPPVPGAPLAPDAGALGPRAADAATTGEGGTTRRRAFLTRRGW